MFITRHLAIPDLIDRDGNLLAGNEVAGRTGSDWYSLRVGYDHVADAEVPVVEEGQMPQPQDLDLTSTSQ